MNRQPLADLTPELIADLESTMAAHNQDECADIIFCHGPLIIECMRVALRWRNEMDQMKEERG